MTTINQEPRLMTKRDLLKRVGLGVGLLIAGRFIDPRSATTASADNSGVDFSQALKEYGSRLGVNAVGYRTSNGWVGTDGFGYMAYQRAILQRDQVSGGIRLWNTLDQMHNLGLDPKLDDSSLGVTIPPQEDFSDGSNGSLDAAIKARVVHFNIPPNISNWVNNYRRFFETGAYTSRGKDYGAYDVYRLQRLAVQDWRNGLVQPILVGDAYKAAGLIPQEVLLAQPDTGISIPTRAEIPTLPFPEKIGNLITDGVEVHNMGTKMGVKDNNDPLNNWQAVVEVLRKYAPNDRFRFFYYDSPADVPAPETLRTPYAYDSVYYWQAQFPGSGLGKITAGQNSEGVWENHLSLPIVRPEDRDSLSRSIVIQVLSYSYTKDNLFASQPIGIANYLRQEALDPYNSRKMNFSLKVAYT